MRLNDNISQYRKLAGLSQEQLAERLKVSRQTVSRWENGIASPGMERLYQLGEVLNVSITALLGVQKEEPQDAILRQRELEQQLIAYNRQVAALKNKKRGQILLGAAFAVLLLLIFLLFSQTTGLQQQLQNSKRDVLERISELQNVVVVGNADIKEKLDEHNFLLRSYSFDVQPDQKGGFTLKLLLNPKTISRDMTVQVVDEEGKAYAAKRSADDEFYVSIPVALTDSSIELQLQVEQGGLLTTQTLPKLFPSQWQLLIEGPECGISDHKLDDKTIELTSSGKLRFSSPVASLDAQNGYLLLTSGADQIAKYQLDFSQGIAGEDGTKILSYHMSGKAPSNCMEQGVVITYCIWDNWGRYYEDELMSVSSGVE